MWLFFFLVTWTPLLKSKCSCFCIDIYYKCSLYLHYNFFFFLISLIHFILNCYVCYHFLWQFYIFINIIILLLWFYLFILPIFSFLSFGIMSFSMHSSTFISQFIHNFFKLSKLLQFIITSPLFDKHYETQLVSDWLRCER